MYTEIVIEPIPAQNPILYVNLLFHNHSERPQNRDLSAFPFNSAASASLRQAPAGLPQPAAALILAAPSRPASGAGATGAAVATTSSASSAAPSEPHRHHERQLIQLYFIATKHSAADKRNSGNRLHREGRATGVDESIRRLEAFRKVRGNLSCNIFRRVQGGAFLSCLDRVALCRHFIGSHILHNSEKSGELVSKGVPHLVSAGYQSEASGK